MPRTFSAIYGVDFSGAKDAGRNCWIARCELADHAARLRLTELAPLERLAGTAERAPALAHLVQQIAESDDALWGMDFPFGLPIEVMAEHPTWPRQLRHVRDWTEEAYALGLWCVARARTLGGKLHVRRTTDVEAHTPFDCYHYRIIYQTFHGMRDVLGPLGRSRGTAVLPFQYGRLGSARRVVVESCPGSTLKRLGLPHQRYKQPAGGKLTAVRLRTRRAILAGLSPHVDVPPAFTRSIMRNPGGDALDAVVAAVGAWQGWRTADHRAIVRHPRYRREGYLYI